eukprot:8074910-Heterocapsa_arctica.AAC.1
MGALQETVGSLAAALGQMATMSQAHYQTLQQDLKSIGTQAQESRLKVSAEKPILTASSADMLRLELKRFNIVLNDA